MTSRRLKDNFTGTSEHEDSGYPQSRWQLQAVIAAIVCWIGMNGIVFWAVGDSLPSLPVVGKFWISLIPIHGAAFFGALALLRQRVPPGKRLRELDLLPARSGMRMPRVVKVSAFTALLFFPCGSLINQFSKWFIELAGFQPTPPPMAQFLQQLDSVPLLISLIVAAVIIAPLVEEILFRLVLFDALRPMGVGSAAVVAAGAFAFLHGTVVQAPALFVLGLVLQYMRGRYRTLWAPITLHATFNSISVLLFWALSSVPAG